jgi:hypothetical protein
MSHSSLALLLTGMAWAHLLFGIAGCPTSLTLLICWLVCWDGLLANDSPNSICFSSENPKNSLLSLLPSSFHWRLDWVVISISSHELIIKDNGGGVDDGGWKKREERDGFCWPLFLALASSWHWLPLSGIKGSLSALLGTQKSARGKKIPKIENRIGAAWGGGGLGLIFPWGLAGRDGGKMVILLKA